jgi:hypothetical protein
MSNKCAISNAIIGKNLYELSNIFMNTVIFLAEAIRDCKLNSFHKMHRKGSKRTATFVLNSGRKQKKNSNYS